jgi:transcriptional regulator with XRE-family HTH domain
MIKNDARRELTAAQIEGFRQALTNAGRDMTGKRAITVRGSYEGMIRQLEDELREYDELKSGELTLPNVGRLDQIAPFVAKMRIAKGVSQTELARRLGVSKQVISRYEETEYQTVAIARLQEILDAIRIKALVTLNAQRSSVTPPLNCPRRSFWGGGTTSNIPRACPRWPRAISKPVHIRHQRGQRCLRTPSPLFWPERSLDGLHILM